MTIWLSGTIALLLSLVPCGIVILRSRHLTEWMVALQMAGTVGVLVLVTHASDAAAVVL